MVVQRLIDAMDSTRSNVLEKAGLWIMIGTVLVLAGSGRRRRGGRLAEDLGCGFFVFCFVAGLVIWLTGRFWEKALERRRYDIYTGATRSHADAHIVTGRDVERDRIELPGPPCPAVIRYYHHDFADGRANYTEFTAAPDRVPGALRLSSPDWAGLLNQYYGGADIAIGESGFDDRYLIQSNPPELAPEFLDARTRDAIRALDRYGQGPFLLEIRPGRVLVRVSSRIREGPLLARFIDQCYALVARHAPPAVPAGVVLEPTVVAGDAKCLVCGARIGPAKRTVCGRCATPHHAECWNYNDGCATFGCGARKGRAA